jgi:PAS domain S-box-containing protein
MTGQRLLLEVDKPEWLTQMGAVLEMLNEGVIITNDRREVLFANSLFVEMTGIARPDIVGSDFCRFYSSQEYDFLTRQSDISSRQGQNRFEFVVPQENGGRLPVIISSWVLENFVSRSKLTTFTDISEQVRAEEELRSANVRLQERQMEIEEDLRLAARVQNSLVPKPLVRDKVSVDSFFNPAHSIGGDFALVNLQDNEHVGLLIGDVSGHGVGSALVANRIYSETDGHLRRAMPFTDMFSELNRFLIEDLAGSGMFVTAATARIDARGRRMVFAGAGHPPAMLARRGQNPIMLESRSMILGAFPDAVRGDGSQDVPLEPDDRIVLYTDGITEVFSAEGEMLGIEGVREIVRSASALPAEQMKQRILDDVAAWRSGPATDDVSLMVVHVR